ncbi:MAG TPA: hypothetical protein VEA78_07570 [Acidimicrobiales bacterium]|nr:hypothetical protein [Acidimicrobiales bacterium]
MTTPTLFFPGSPSIDADADAEIWRAGITALELDVTLVPVERRGEPMTTVARRACTMVDGPFRVLGVSGGAPWAVATAVGGGDRVERLTIVSGFPHPMHGLGLLSGAAGKDVDGVRKWAREVLTSIPGADVDALLESFVEDCCHLREPWTFDPAGVTAPTTVFHAADDDRCEPDGARWLAATIPGARYVEWPEGGHFAMFQHVEEMLGAL